uniref:Tc1-like transposase DDE domain-containing protein n=1 Tax=Scleropages formosus TaxID=113540 RepID=A0A8C9REE1_SCLFO
MPMIFRQHCIKNRHDSVMEITAWAQTPPEIIVCEHGSPCHPQMQVKALLCKEEAICEHDPDNTIQKCRRLLWTKVHLKWTEAKWKTVLWSDESKSEVLLGNHGRHVLRTKEERGHPASYQRSVQKPASLMVWGCLSAYGTGSLHISKGTTNGERYIQVSEQHMRPSRQRLFQGRPCIFQQDNAKPHTASITTAWLRNRRVRVLNWPACSPDLSPIEDIWHIMKRKMRQRRQRTVEHLESCIRHEWDSIPLSKLQQV